VDAKEAKLLKEESFESGIDNFFLQIIICGCSSHLLGGVALLRKPQASSSASRSNIFQPVSRPRNGAGRIKRREKR
jgi:hypothetical protein